MAKTDKRAAAAFEPDARTKSAIERAERAAGDDDEKFVRVLTQEMLAGGRKSGSTRAVMAAATPTKSFHIYNDPRYLANARELARRTLGGVRVLGGEKVKKGDFLDCVAVGSDDRWCCTGTLIADDVVLTAGHCVDFATRVFFGTDVSKAGKIVDVKKRVRHPKYHKGQRNDLMVLLLAEKVTTVAPRKLASKAVLDKLTDGRVVGFGTTDAGGMFGYGIKRFVDVPVASVACRGKVDGKDDSVTYGCDVGLELIAGRPLLEQDSCKGDSGGPFYVMSPKGSGKQSDWLLGGATSRATDSAMHECGDGGVYVRLDRYRTWIDSIPGVSLP